MAYFLDRADAGKKLAKALKTYAKEPVVVFGLPRGGVVPALEIARALKAPLELILAHKIGHPFQPEYAIAAVSEGGEVVSSPREKELVQSKQFASLKQRQIDEIERRKQRFLQGRKPVSAEGKTAILVDDGIATGLTMKAAIKDLKKRKPHRIVIAVPMSPQSTASELSGQVDDVVCLVVQSDADFLGSISLYYEDFPQVTDDEVVRLLKKYWADQ